MLQVAQETNGFLCDKCKLIFGFYYNNASCHLFIHIALLMKIKNLIG